MCLKMPERDFVFVVVVSHLEPDNELRSMRQAISGRIDRALNFSALWIGGMCLWVEPYEQSITHARQVSTVPVAAVVVTVWNFTLTTGWPAY